MKSILLDDIIVAISTPIGSGGIGIVRMSGNGCINIADKVFRSVNNISLLNRNSHTLTYGHIYDNDKIIDEVMVSVMKSPNTYTREDIVEINCHGGIIVLKRIVDLLVNNGARLSEPGEFTKRAFLNGRIDLSQAEAVIDIINSKTDISRQIAVNKLEGKLKDSVSIIRDNLLDVIALIEVFIDYPEHEIEEETYINIDNTLYEILNSINKLIETADKGRIIQEGISTVILGKPNVGKSSLLNIFLNEERAIVTDIPGTTRDTLEEFVNIDGVVIKLIDTAGIRKTDDIVEQIGVTKSKDYASKADLVLMMIDCSKDFDNEDIDIIDFIKDKKYIIILNKIDLENKIDKNKILDYLYNYKVNKDFDEKNIIDISVKNNKGIDILINRIKDLFFVGDLNISDEVIISNIRNKNSLYNAKKSIEKAKLALEMSIPEDLVSIDLQNALNYLGEITGETVDEEIIDRIFSKFCLGK